MSTPANATVYAIRGQAFNFSGRLVAPTTGNPITGGLGTITTIVSKDDGTFVNSSAVATERNGTGGMGSGWFSQDVSGAEMTANKVDLQVSAAGAVAFCVSIVTVDLTPETVRYDQESVIRFERLWLNLHSYWFNLQYNSTGAGAVQQLFNRLGIMFAQGLINRGDVSSTRGKMS